LLVGKKDSEKPCSPDLRTVLRYSLKAGLCGKVWNTKIKIYIDIDNTICSQEKDYAKAKPFPDRIEDYNKLYELGHEITYWTARGTTTGLDWSRLTEEQLKRWGVKYHHLKLGKPDYDMFICDKASKPKKRR